MQSFRAEVYGRLSLLSFLTHFLLYLELQPSDDICISSYCDNFSLPFHTGDIVSSNWYAKPDHDVIMTLSALQTNSLLRLASLHVRAHQDENCNFDLLPSSDRLASEQFKDLRAEGKAAELSPLPAWRAYLRDDTGT